MSKATEGSSNSSWSVGSPGVPRKGGGVFLSHLLNPATLLIILYSALSRHFMKIHEGSQEHQAL